MCQRRFLPVTSILMLASFMILWTNHLWARTWTTKDGIFSVEAEFVDLIDDKVSLLKENGRIVKVPLNALSDSNQKVAKAIMSARNVKHPIKKPDGNQAEKKVSSVKEPENKTENVENKLSEIKNAPEPGDNGINPKHLAIRKPPERTPKVMPTQPEPIPSLAAQKKARKVLMDLYKDEVKQSRSSLAKSRNFSIKLLQTGDVTRNDLPKKYVLYQMVNEFAMQSADFEMAAQAIDSMAKNFKVDALSLNTEALDKALRAKLTIEQKRSLLSWKVKLIDELFAANRFEESLKQTRTATSLARKVRDTSILKQLLVRNKKIIAQQKVFTRVKKALSQLDQSPTDPDANLVVGKYRCFYKDDWAAGLQNLALGGDTKLKALAKMDLGNPTEAKERVAIGNGWWALSLTEKGLTKERIQIRAAMWYRKSLPGLTSLEKQDVEKRLKKYDTIGVVRLSYIPKGWPLKMSTGGIPVNKLSPTAPTNVRNVPALRHRRRLWGAFQLGSSDALNRIHFIIDYSSPREVIMYVDADQDGNFANNVGPLKNQGTGAFASILNLQLRHPDSKTPTPYKVWFFISDEGWKNNQPSFYSRCHWKGILLVDGVAYNVVLFDSPGDGDYSNNAVAIDINGDGIAQKSEMFRPGEKVHVGQKKLTVKWISPSGKEVHFGR